MDDLPSAVLMPGNTCTLSRDRVQCEQLTYGVPVRETQLSLEHKKQWLERYPDDFYHKIQDGLGSGGKKPFDSFIWGWRNGTKQIWAKEFKLHKSHNAFSLAKIEDHQIRGLQRAQKAGAIATVFLGIRCMLDVDTQTRLKLRLRRITVDVEFRVDEIVTLLESGQKSIPVLPYIEAAMSGSSLPADAPGGPPELYEIAERD